MRKKLDTRFPAARIKKIMQADEDIGKIAMAVPLLVSKALELFLQDLCDRTYEVTLKKGAKTVNSLHLKQCIQNFNTFDFLKDTISRVPDLGGSEVVSEDISATKRRKISEDEEYVNDEEAKRTQMSEIGHISSSGRDRGRGRGRGRGRPRGSGTIDRELTLQYVKCEDVVEVHYENGEVKQEPESRPDEVADAAELGTTRGKEAGKVFRNFDLNVDLNEHGDYLNEKGDSSPALRGATTKSSTWPASNRKHEDILGWSLDDMEKMALDPTQLANLNGGISEEEEDYDEGD